VRELWPAGAEVGVRVSGGPGTVGGVSAAAPGGDRPGGGQFAVLFFGQELEAAGGACGSAAGL